jgi:hypothetical protein
MKNAMKDFVSPRPKAVNKSLLISYLKCIQESAHDAHVSLETLQYSVDYFLFAALDPEGCKRFTAAEDERWERERPAREAERAALNAALEASRLNLNRLLGEGWDKPKSDPNA